jgi:tRNA(Ile)-lysidine synthase
VKRLLEHVAGSIRTRKLWRKGGRVLVAVSGGVDSMVLLHVLVKLKAEFGTKLLVAHFNHQLRGRESDADERFVRQTAAKLGLPFHAGRGQVKSHAAEQGISVEMAARELRHAFLAQTAVALKCPVLATAHHADDQVETFFLRLLRGSGGEGLAGMKWISASPANRRVQIVRPLLDVAKEELELFAKANRLEFRNDASNASHDILRNRVRHELLPLLRAKFQPALNRTVLRVMDLVSADAEAVAQIASAWRPDQATADGWAKLPVAGQRRVLQQQLLQMKIPADFELIETLRLHSGKKVNCEAGGQLVRDVTGRVQLLGVVVAVEFRSAERKLNLRRQKTVRFGGLQLAWQMANGTGRVIKSGAVGLEQFDADAVGDNIVLRHWRPGDRFQPIGMKSAVKLQDWFTNLKLPPERRRELVVACGRDGEIFWIEGQRIGERFKLRKSTERTLIWRWTGQ